MTESTFAADFQRGRWDTAFFAKRFLNITIHPGQIRFARSVLARDATKWRPAYLTVALSAGNRAGKTLALAVVIIHSCVYKMGLKPPGDSEKEVAAWMRAEYTWFHFGIQQEVSDLVFLEMTKIFSGIHEAQKDGCPLTSEVPNAATWEKKYQGEYRWFQFHAMLGGAQVHFRTTSERALGSLGQDMHGISYDECAFDSHLDFVVNEVLHLRRLGTGGQLILISTPTEGITAFADIWEQGNPESPDRKPGRISLRMSSRDNVGYGLDQHVFDRLIVDMPDDLVPQNIDGYFIQGRAMYFNAQSVDAAFDDDLPEMQPAENKHLYVQGVDPALSQDPAWSIVLDVTKVPAVGVKVTRLLGKKTTDAIVALTADSHNAYNASSTSLRSWCSTAIDATGFGGKMFREALDGIQPLRNIEFGGSKQKKLKLLGDVKTALDQGKIKFPRSGPWLALRRQLLGYKLADRAIEQDAVMALACAWAEARRTPADAEESVPFDAFAYYEAPVTPAQFYAQQERGR